MMPSVMFITGCEFSQDRKGGSGMKEEKRGGNRMRTGRKGVGQDMVSRDELDWSTNELRNCLRAIDWDLEDLSETINIVESNPGKFKLGDNELQERRDFVERTRKSVQEMKDHLSSPSAVAQAEKKNRQVGGGRRQWCAIGVLVTIMIVVLILFFAL
ncbi:Syntaxin-10 [Larimichthys crocea]|uniref:Uncharacterized protein n=1 Tax=Larimichthys crocea TaxID=215358 RepID=A0ACD3RVA7_LARCR|nr:Syntaxin-10 [Larimichthys crocea]